VITVVAALLAGLLVTPPGVASAEDPPQEVAGGRAALVAIWRTGGPIARERAEKVLTGTDAQVRQFLDVDYPKYAKLDDRLAINRIQDAGGPTIKDAAQRALDDGSAGALRAFLEEGYKTPKDVDLRVSVNRVMAVGGPRLREAAQVALDAGTKEAQTQFLDEGWRAPYALDQRLRVNQAMSVGGPNVRAGAQRVLDLGRVEAYEEFLDIDMPVYQARDIEHATVAELAGVAKAAVETATTETEAAKQAAEKALREAELAKQAAEEAARATDAAAGNSAEAASAAGRAAAAANLAAAAAREAVGAANAASSAAWRAANAASRAATAASLAGQAASRAFSAASAVTLDASKVPAARQAAIDAAKVADDADQAAVAAEAAGNAATQAGNAVTAANSAADNSNAAARAAQESAGFAERAGADASEARAAAAAAQAAAARANRAANAAKAFAAISAAAARTAKEAAQRAAQNARDAAAAANRAADHAGHAADAAKEATEHANAATAAANTAVDAANQAQKIFDAARTADSEKLAVKLDQAREAAMAGKSVIPALKGSLTWDMAQLKRQDEQTRQLLAEATAPGTNPQVVAQKGREAAVRLVRNGGAWTKEGALAALSATDEEVRAFVQGGLSVAQAQDDRVTLKSLTQTGTPKLKAAGEAALAGSDADVQRFLVERNYDGRDLDERLEVNRIMSEARDQGRPATQQAAQKALDASTHDAYSKFLATGQFSAAGVDDRVQVNRVRGDSANGAETVGLAQIVLDGAPGLMRQFLNVDQYRAARHDQEQAAHNAEVGGYVAKAAASAAAASHLANEAQAAAATARNAAAEAAEYARVANEFAVQAQTHAANAQKSADDAAKSAEAAARSARTAADAANRATASAKSAVSSAVSATRSANQAAAHANAAYSAWKKAYDEAKAAGAQADEAVTAANHARDRLIDLATSELFRVGTQAQKYCEMRAGPLGSPEFNACIGKIFASPDELAQRALTNAGICQLLNQGAPGSQFEQSCLSQVLDPDFEINQMLTVVNALLATYVAIVGPPIIALTVARFAWACIGSEVCTLLLSAVDPAAAAFTPWLSVGTASATSALIAVRLTVKLEQILVETQTVLTRLSQIASKVIGKVGAVFPGCTTPGNSFTAGTKVLMGDGSAKDIAEVVRGDVVATQNPVTGLRDTAAVTDPIVGDGVKRLVDVDVGAGVLRATDGHPFWVEESRSWVPAGRLVVGQHLRTPDGTVAVKGLSVRDETTRVHNLDVSSPDTFYVFAGDRPVLVHNTDCLEHLVLGLREGNSLREFAKSINGNIVTIDDYKGVVWTATELMRLDPKSIKLSFRMDNIEGAELGVMEMLLNSVRRNNMGIGGATDWELTVLYEQKVIGYVDFYLRGVKQTNPFA
jgi:hypothetical protein